jgi:ABC-type lipoprotein release transport system permease subunit
VQLDDEAAVNSGMDVGERSSYSVAGQIFNGTMVGFIGEVPTMTDRTREGSMVVDFDAINAWVNGPASWSYRTSLARVDGPDEIWVATDNPDAAVRRVTGQLPTEPDAVFSIFASESEFSSRPVQVGLVAILFVGAIVSVVLALAGVTGYVLLAVSRRAREMGVLRALGFQRSGVAATFAIEQVVVVGLGALIGTLGGIALMWTMIGFLQLGETAQLIEPEIVLAVPWNVLLVYIGVVGLMLIVSVVWATRRVSARRMSEVLREVER